MSHKLCFLEYESKVTKDGGIRKNNAAPCIVKTTLAEQKKERRAEEEEINKIQNVRGAY